MKDGYGDHGKLGNHYQSLFYALFNMFIVLNTWGLPTFKKILLGCKISHSMIQTDKSFSKQDLFTRFVIFESIFPRHCVTLNERVAKE